MRFLEFEKPIADLEAKIEELRGLSNSSDINIAAEINKLQIKSKKLLHKMYKNLTPWQKVLIARHEERPQFLDYLDEMTNDFLLLSGDRLSADDQAILGGICTFRDKAVMVIGQQKGDTTEARIKHNFGMARPEGYRKAKRLIELADRFNLPIITFVNTSGAYPGIDSEENGQSEAIASCTLACAKAKVPIVSVIIGEGGSGGAIAIATSNRVLMLENSFYSVISPEGCASILWKTAKANEQAASEQKLTAQDLFNLDIIDKIILEPFGGAHRDKKATIQSVLDAIDYEFRAFKLDKMVDFKQHREMRFFRYGASFEFKEHFLEPPKI